MTFYEKYYKSNYEELLTYYPSFYRDVKEMLAILNANGYLLDIAQDGIERVFQNNFISLMDENAIAEMEKFLHIQTNENYDLETRRALILAHFVTGNHIGEPEIKQITAMFTDSDVDIELGVGMANIELAVDFQDVPRKKEYYSILRQKIPAHLGISITYHAETDPISIDIGLACASELDICETSLPQRTFTVTSMSATVYEAIAQGIAISETSLPELEQSDVALTANIYMGAAEGASFTETYLPQRS